MGRTQGAGIGWDKGGHKLTQAELYLISCKFKGGSGTRDTARGQAHPQGSCEKRSMKGMTALLLASVRAPGIGQGSNWQPCPQAASSLRQAARLFISDERETQLRDPRSCRRETVPELRGITWEPSCAAAGNPLLVPRQASTSSLPLPNPWAGTHPWPWRPRSPAL